MIQIFFDLGIKRNSHLISQCSVLLSCHYLSHGSQVTKRQHRAQGGSDEIYKFLLVLAGAKLSPTKCQTKYLHKGNRQTVALGLEINIEM